MRKAAEIVATALCFVLGWAVFALAGGLVGAVIGLIIYYWPS